MKVEPEIESLSPYVPGLPIEEVQRRYGLKHVDKLASNENPLGPSPKVISAVTSAAAEVHLYPDGSCFELRRAVSTHFGIPDDHLVFGSGSDELIDLLIRTYGKKGDKVLLAPYAFNAYAIRAQASRLVSVSAPARDGFRMDISEFLKIVDREKPKFVFLDNPNNPTGSYYSAAELKPLIQALAGRDDLFLVFDEAYNEFVRSTDPFQSLKVWKDAANVIVLRTFSKTYALAGLRLGLMIARPEIANYVNRIRLPFNVNLLVQKAAIAALADREHLKKTVELTWQGLDFFYEELRKMGVPFQTSQGNFVMFDTERNASLVNEELLKLGTIMRPLKNYGLPRHLRLSVGLPEQNQRAIQRLQKVLAQIPQGEGL